MEISQASSPRTASKKTLPHRSGAQAASEPRSQPEARPDRTTLSPEAAASRTAGARGALGDHPSPTAVDHQAETAQTVEQITNLLKVLHENGSSTINNLNLDSTQSLVAGLAANFG